MKVLNSIIFFITIVLSVPQNINAQKHTIVSNNIASVQVVAGTNWLCMPVTMLKGGEPINIAFDDLTHTYHRYAYRLQHCEADWSPSEGIFESDYCEGFADGNIIDDCEESINTQTLYTHYKLTIPNEQCKIKMSGNYKLTVYDENTGDTAFHACFMVVEPLISLTMKVTSNTDIDNNKQHQQVELNLGYGALRINDPLREIKTVLMQNACWDDARQNVKPQLIRSDGLTWMHNKSFIFNGGNEYRKFEILDVTNPTLGIEDVGWDGKQYHAYIWTDLPRSNYIYDEDANGAFYIRNSDNIDNDRISEYVMVHFRLKTPRQNGKVYINGQWTYNQLLPQYEMTYNEIAQQYEATIMLKQGYYSYRYLTLNDDNIIKPVNTEGNFFQTENDYQALIYFRGIGERTDRLVGYKSIKFKL